MVNETAFLRFGLDEMSTLPKAELKLGIFSILLKCIFGGLH